MLNQGLGLGYFIVFHSIQSELPYGKVVSLVLLCILWDWVSMTDSHIGLVHDVRRTMDCTVIAVN